ncbi:proline rich transmembrane protein 1B-like [Dysidea avara]|uniref:proline rich transmembrane protein 1B-like n=1 Tax=Dysidea avara TaxID=196820 RepID=UPI003332A50A
MSNYREVTYSSYPSPSSSYQPIGDYGGTSASFSQPQRTHAKAKIVHHPATVVPAFKPKNFLTFSLINIFFCCIAFGIAALIFSLRVDSYYAAGRITEAWAASNIARKLNMLGLIIGIVFYVVASILVVVLLTIDDHDEVNDN